MFLHIENDESISINNVIGVFNLQLLQENKVNKNFLFKISDENKRFKTLILTNEKGKIKEYFSNISVQTIMKKINE